MIRSFNREEKLALIGLVKYLVNADGMVHEEELNRIHSLASNKGMEDFREIFNEADRLFKSFEDLKDFLFRVHNDTHKRDIVQNAVTFALSDAVMKPSENQIIDFICEFWKIDPSSFY
jgi:uncharacterized tellurite resistance protein B-like protein